MFNNPNQIARTSHITQKDRMGIKQNANDIGTISAIQKNLVTAGSFSNIEFPDPPAN